MRSLADLAGLSSGTISALEHGKMQPALGTMLALQRAFSLDSIESLLGELPSVTLVNLDDTREAAVS
jgi:transcriptional regulator with XRE-family HTH domain